MRRIWLTWIATSIVVTVLCGSAHAAAYKAALLDPSFAYYHSEALGISGPSIVGNGTADSHQPRRALFWPDASASPIDLHPAIFYDSIAGRTSNGYQVGLGHTFEGKQHALFWSGTAGSVVDLHPADANESVAQDLSDGRQAGFASFGANNSSFHAMIWSGTATSFVDLHPAGYIHSVVEAISGHTQVGHGSISVLEGRHALLWHDTAQSVVDLNPAGFVASTASAISQDTQVGSGVLAGYGFRALLWKGTPQSAVDLTPPGFSQCLALNGSSAGQVGYGSGTATNGNDQSHALYWNSTASSVVDLHQYLADLPMRLVDSYALKIDDDGTIVGWAEDEQSRRYAVIWRPVPEPTALGLAVIATIIVAVRGRQRVLTL